MPFRSTTEIIKSLQIAKESNLDLAPLLEETIQRLLRQEDRHRNLSNLVWGNNLTPSMVSTSNPRTLHK